MAGHPKFSKLLRQLKEYLKKGTKVHDGKTGISFLIKSFDALCEVVKKGNYDFEDQCEIRIDLLYLAKTAVNSYACLKRDKTVDEILEKMQYIHNVKNYDYSEEKDPLSNLRRSERLGIPAWKGTLTRMGDKIARLENFYRGKEYKIKDESAEDALIDLANYSLLDLILFDEVYPTGR